MNRLYQTNLLVHLMLLAFAVLTNATFIIQNNVLIISPNAVSAQSASQMLISYGIPYTVLIVPQEGTMVPALNNTDGSGNFNLVVVESQVSYFYGNVTGWQSALTVAQWKTIYDYQTMYGIRMVHKNVYPGTPFGTSARGGCCNPGEDQTVTLDAGVAAAMFPTAGLK